VKWRATRLKYLASLPITNGLGEQGRDAGEGSVRYLRTTDIAGPRTLDPSKWASLEPEVARRAPVQRGDLLICAAGSLGVTYLHDSDESACYAGYLARFRPGREVDARFVSYWAQSQGFFDQIATGAVRSTIDNFSAGKIRKLEISVPPLDEQRRIADFLDTETARLDNLQALRKRQVAQMTERAQSELDRLFGESTFRHTRLKFLLRQRISYGVLVPRFVDEGGVRLIRVNDLVELKERAAGLAQIEMGQSNEYRRTLVAANDLLVVVVGSVGRSAVAPPEVAGANLARAVARLCPVDEVGAPLLWLWMQSSDFQDQVALATGGDTAQPTLNVGDLGNFALCLPEGERWRRGLAAEAQFTVSVRDDLITSCARQGALLSERRQALITAAVTGQLDVTTGRLSHR